MADKNGITSVTVADDDVEQNQNATTTSLSIGTLNPAEILEDKAAVATMTTGSVVVVVPPPPAVLLDDNAIQAAIAAAVQAARNVMQAQLDATRQELVKAKTDLAQVQSNKKQSSEIQDNDNVTEEEIDSHVTDHPKKATSSTVKKSTRSKSLKENVTEKKKIREKRKSLTTPTTDGPKKRAATTTLEKRQANTRITTTSSKDVKGKDAIQKTKIKEKRKSATATLTKDVPKKRAGTNLKHLQANNIRKLCTDAVITSSTKKKKQDETPKKLDRTSTSIKEYHSPAAARTRSSLSTRQSRNNKDTNTVQEKESEFRRLYHEQYELRDGINEYHSPAAARTRSSLSTRQGNKKDTTTVRELIKLIKTPPKRKKLKDPNDESNDPNLENGNDDNEEDNDDINSGSDAKVPAVTKRRSPRSSLSRQSKTKVQKSKLTSKKPPKRKNMDDHDEESDVDNDVDDDDDPNFVNYIGTDDDSEDDDDINSDSDAKVPAVATRKSSSSIKNTKGKTVKYNYHKSLLDDDTTTKVIPIKAKHARVKTTSRKTIDKLLRNSNKTLNSKTKKNEKSNDHSARMSINEFVDNGKKAVVHLSEKELYWSQSFASLHTFRYIMGHCNVGSVVFHVPTAKKRYRELYRFVKNIRDEYNNATHHDQLLNNNNDNEEEIQTSNNNNNNNVIQIEKPSSEEPVLNQLLNNNNDNEEEVHNNNNDDAIQIERPSSENLLLNEERIADLLKLGFNFDWNSDVQLSVDFFGERQDSTNTNRAVSKMKYAKRPVDFVWEKQFSQLCVFAKTHGNCDVRQPPNRNVDNDTEEAAEYRALFAWVKQVRRLFRVRIEQELKLLHSEYIHNAPWITSTLSNERIISLIKIGFHFNIYSPREELPIIRIPSQISNQSISIANPVEDNMQGVTLADSEMVEDPKINNSRKVELHIGDLHTDDERPREKNVSLLYAGKSILTKKGRPTLTLDPSWRENWEKMVQLLQEYKSTYGSVAELAGYKIDESEQTEVQVTPIDDKYKDLRCWIDTVRYYLKIHRNNTSDDQFFNAEKIETLLEISVSLVQDPPPGHKHRKKYQKKTIKETVKGMQIDGRKMTGEEIRDMVWELHFQELKRYSIEHQTFSIPETERGKETDQYRELRSWVYGQKTHYENMMNGKSSQMTAQRVAKLMEIGFRFKKGKVWTFEERIEQYKKFLEDNDGTHPTVKAADGLGGFVCIVRRNYRNIVQGQSCGLDQGQFDLLKSIGFTFNDKFLLKPRAPPKKAIPWEENFALLVEFKEKHGHFKAHKDTTLSKWIHNQRRLYREYLAGKPSNQIAERALKMKNIGFKFMVRDPSYIPKHLRPETIPQHISWEDSYQKLIEFKQINGHTRVSKYTCTSQLYCWAHNQRKHYSQYISGKKSPMTEEKITKLNEVGFEFSLFNTGAAIKMTRKKQPSSSNAAVSTTTGSPEEDPTTSHGAKDDDDDDETESSDSDSSSSDDDDEKEILHDNNQVDDNADDSSRSEVEEQEEEGYEYHHHHENTESTNVVSAVSHPQSNIHLSHEEANEYAWNDRHHLQQHEQTEEAEQLSDMNNLHQQAANVLLLQHQQQDYLQQQQEQEHQYN